MNVSKPPPCREFSSFDSWGRSRSNGLGGYGSFMSSSCTAPLATFGNFGVSVALLVGEWKKKTPKGGKCQMQGESEARSSDNFLVKLCKGAALTETNVATVLVPRIDSNQVLQNVLKILSQQKQGQLAFATLEAVVTAGQVKLKAPNYTVVLSSFAESKLWKQALTLLKDMPKAEVQPNVISFNAAISVCEKAGRWQEAVTLLEAMPQAKVQPNVISYSAAISACSKGGQWQEALMLFEAMPKSSEMSSATIQPSVPARRVGNGRNH